MSWRLEVHLTGLERAGVTRRRGLATSHKELKGNRDINVEVEKLELESGAKAGCSFKLNESLKHWTALVGSWVSDTNVNQPPKQIHTGTQFESVNGACSLCRRVGWWAWSVPSLPRSGWSGWRVEHGRHSDWWNRQWNGWLHNWRDRDGRDSDGRDSDGRHNDWWLNNRRVGDWGVNHGCLWFFTMVLLLGGLPTVATAQNGSGRGNEEHGKEEISMDL